MKKLAIALSFCILCLAIGYFLYLDSDIYKKNILSKNNWQNQIDLVLPKNAYDRHNETENIRLIGKVRFLSNGTFIRSYHITTPKSENKHNEDWPTLTDKGKWSVMDSYLVLHSEGINQLDELPKDKAAWLDRIVVTTGNHREQIFRIYRITPNTILLVGIDTISKVLVAI